MAVPSEDPPELKWMVVFESRPIKLTEWTWNVQRFHTRALAHLIYHQMSQPYNGGPIEYRNAVLSKVMHTEDAW